jgi:hypothetical protein
MPILLLRVLVGAGLLALGYYVGREVGRVESIRQDLEGRKPPAPGEPETRDAGSQGTPPHAPGASRSP